MEQDKACRFETLNAQFGMLIERLNTRNSELHAMISRLGEYTPRPNPTTSLKCNVVSKTEISTHMSKYSFNLDNLDNEINELEHSIAEASHNL